MFLASIAMRRRRLTSSNTACPPTVTVYTDVDDHGILNENDTLDGGSVLPGFALPLRELFAELDRQG